jgi:hypothetical protein
MATKSDLATRRGYGNAYPDPGRVLRPRGDGTAADRYDRARDTSIGRPRGRQRLGRQSGRPRLRLAVPVGHADVPVPHADPDAHPDVRVPQHATTHADPDPADTDADADVHLHADPDADQPDADAD